MFGITFYLQFMLFLNLLLGFIWWYLVFSFELCSSSIVVRYNYSSVLFHHPLNKQIDLT
jgi:hypothetical protein